MREEDILDAITREGPTIALVLFPGVQYYTGQWFPMQSVTKAAKEQVRIYFQNVNTNSFDIIYRAAYVGGI